MENFEKIVEKAFADKGMSASDIPAIELYMDQVLTLFDDGLSGGKRFPDDKLLTKTMINNYSKEHIIMPVKGKKYSREQLMQLLCIMGLKQALALGDVKKLVACEQENERPRFETAYQTSRQLGEQLRGKASELLLGLLGETKLDDRDSRLAAALAISSAIGGLRRVCEGIVDSLED